MPTSKIWALEAKMATQTGYKTSELGIIPQDWDVVELGKVCDIDTENLTSNTDLDYEFDYISLEQIDNGHLLNTEKYKFKDAPSRARRVVRKNDVLISTVRPNLMSHYYVKNEVRDLICSTGFSVVRGTNKLNMPYLYHHLFANIINSQINLVVVGSNYPAINSHDIKNLKIPLPSTPEQTAIATALSDTDELISSLQRLIAKKKAIKLSAMQNLLSGKIRLPEFAQRTDGSPKTMRQTELGLLPEDWEIRRVGDFTDCTAGGTPSTQVSSYWGGEIPWMSSGELHLKQVYDVVGRITEKGLENSSTKFVPANSVLIGLAGQGKTRGTVAISKIPLCTNQSIAAIFPTDEFNSTFLFYNLENRYDELRALSTGDGGRGGLNLTIIRNVLVKFPSLPEQTTIAQLLSDMDAEIEALECRLKKTQALKQGMMQTLLTGKIRLPLE